MNKRFKIFLALATVVTLLLTSVPFSAVAAEPATTPTRELNGYSETLIEDKTELINSLTDLEGYNGWKDYKITTAKGIVMLSHLVNGTLSSSFIPEEDNRRRFAGRTAYLAADIDMNDTVEYQLAADGKYNFDVVPGDAANLKATANELFSPIGVDKAAPFCGTFDGQGHTVKNLHLVSGKQFVGFFGFLIIADTAVKNLVFDDTCYLETTFGANSTVGSVVAYSNMNALIFNCKSSASLKGTITGGILGEAAPVTVKNCTFAGKTDAGATAGGIVGHCWAHDINVVNCKNLGYVKGGGYAGGIFGRTTKGLHNINLTSCINGGTTWAGNNGNSGGILGLMQSAVNMENCINYGKQEGHSKATKDPFIATADASVSATNKNYTDALQMQKEMLRVSVQLTKGTTQASTQTALRFITSVDGLNYRQVGFRVSLADGGEQLVKNREVVTSTVYEKIGASLDSLEVTYTPYQEFAPVSQYFNTFSITNIPNARFDMNVTVQAFAVCMDGTVIEGDAASFVLSDFFR